MGIFVDEVVVANPRAAFLKAIEGSVKQGGKVTIIGHKSNKFFGTDIWAKYKYKRQIKFGKFTIDKQNSFEGLPNDFTDFVFQRTDNKILDNKTLNTITLIKQ